MVSLAVHSAQGLRAQHPCEPPTTRAGPGQLLGASAPLAAPRSRTWGHQGQVAARWVPALCSCSSLHAAGGLQGTENPRLFLLPPLTPGCSGWPEALDEAGGATAWVLEPGISLRSKRLPDGFGWSSGGDALVPVSVDVVAGG